MSNYSNYPPQQQQQHTPTAATGPRAKCDQVVFEALCKACEIIVGSRTNLVQPSVGAGGHGGTSRSYHPHGGGGAAMPSTRFQLHIPEVAGVRSILSQYRLQLHVPIRVDVYYQHPATDNSAEGTRELLERWCLEYRTVSSDDSWDNTFPASHHHNHHNSNADPMTQLTHVCKRVVVWLRTLYCWSRLLPATRASNCASIGFSIYAHHHGGEDRGGDDAVELTQQGFVWQGRMPPGTGNNNSNNNGVVRTPYGELEWQVMHGPASQLERLWPARTPSVRIKVPQPPPRTPHSPSLPAADTRQFVPRSAPTGDRPPTYTERSRQKQWEAAQQQQQHHAATQYGKSYDAHHVRRRSDRTDPTFHTTQQQHHQHPPTIARRNTTMGVPPPTSSPPSSKDDNPPARVMSGLSLALMMASNDDDVDDTITNFDDGSGEVDKSDSRESGGLDALPVVHNSTCTEQPLGVHDDEEEETDEIKTRRAALHQMPPHLLEQNSPVTTATGEYGYGYNNHIPWQKIQPSNSNPAMVVQRQNSGPGFGRTLSTSPASYNSSPMHTMPTAPPTPPTAYGAAFLGTTPPVVQGLGPLIPPRNRSDSSSSLNSNGDGKIKAMVAPPFQARPAGFLNEAPSSEPCLAQSSTQGCGGHGDPANRTSVTKQPHVASLDSLRSSPFQQSALHMHPENRSSMVSSMSFTPGSDAYLSHLHSAMGKSGLTDLRGSLWSSPGGGSMLPSSLAGSGAPMHPFQQEDDHYSEDMPFAVEMSSDDATSLGFGTSQSKSASASKGVGSSYLGNSSALASLAQKCSAPSHRLKMFERQTTDSVLLSGEPPTIDDGALSLTNDNDGDNNNSMMVNSLADQLQEFRAFGASLHVSKDIDSASPNRPATLLSDKDQLQGSGASSTSTPISLRS